MKKIFLLALLLFFNLMNAEAPSHSDEGFAKNVILLIADGTSLEQYTLARWFKGEKLTIEKHRRGTVMTYIADSVIADSAPAATAYATGVRTADKFISIAAPSSGMLTPELNCPEGAALKPLATILEGAILKGKKTGIVVTCHFTHATPAAFFSHVIHRDDKLNIARQSVESGIDLMFGGGKKYLLPSSEGGLLPEGENLLARLKEYGYAIIEKSGELAALKDEKVWGIFADDDMLPEIDRIHTGSDKEPSLAEMTGKAIEILSKGDKGFFLMVEGSQIDWAGHANDPAYLVYEIIAFDDAAKIAFDFAKKRKDTLVIALSDHNTGGFSIGNQSTDKTYSQTKIEDMLNPLKKMKCSAASIVKRLGKDANANKLKSLLEEFWGVSIQEQTAQELLAAMKNAEEYPQNALCDFVGPKYTIFGWTTHGHTGGDIPFAAYGPGAPEGSIDAPEIGRLCAKALGM
jgi:alkaline phosphatase